jgi:hypothetical protein
MHPPSPLRGAPPTYRGASPTYDRQNAAITSAATAPTAGRASEVRGGLASTCEQTFGWALTEQPVCIADLSPAEWTALTEALQRWAKTATGPAPDPRLRRRPTRDHSPTCWLPGLWRQHRGDVVVEVHVDPATQHGQRVVRLSLIHPELPVGTQIHLGMGITLRAFHTSGR